ncbi:hypothetical protein [Profundibacter sp.]
MTISRKVIGIAIVTFSVFFVAACDPHVLESPFYRLPQPDNEIHGEGGGGHH